MAHLTVLNGTLGRGERGTTVRMWYAMSCPRSRMARILMAHPVHHATNVSSLDILDRRVTGLAEPVRHAAPDPGGADKRPTGERWNIRPR